MEGFEVFTAAAFKMGDRGVLAAYRRVTLYILAINFNYCITPRGRSLAWLGHQVPNLTTRVQIPVTAPKTSLVVVQAKKKRGCSRF